MSRLNETVRTHIACAQYEDACREILAALRERGNDSDLLALLGHVYFDASDSTRAKSFFDQAAFFDREHVDAATGYLRMAMSLPGGMNREVLLARVKNLETPHGYLGRAGYYAVTGKIGEAAREAAAALVKYPDDREVLEDSIDIFVRNNPADERIGKLIAKAKQMGISDRLLETEMTWLYRMGRYEECEAVCKDVAGRGENSSAAKKAKGLAERLFARTQTQTNVVPVPAGVALNGRSPESHKPVLDGAAAERELNALIGLDSVKDAIFRIRKKIMFDRTRQEKLGISYADTASYHFVFSGNPGTGKTTVARLLGAILHDAGLLEQGQLIEAERGDLVGEYQGHTAKKTKEAIERAIGGVLFVDEAYGLVNGPQDDFGHEAIDALVKGIEDHRKELVVILAGYRDEMRELISQNIGLESRFTQFIDFPDYTEDELLLIAKSMAAEQHYVFSADGERAFREKIAKQRVNRKFGNARTVRTLMNDAYTEKAVRFDPDETSIEYMTILTPDDFGISLSKDASEKAADALARLDRLTGLKDVKYEIRSTVKMVDYLKQQRAEGDAGSAPFQNTLHMCFAGNPGTGKTTVARIYAEVLAAIGVSKTGELIEASRSDFVGAYQGHTAKKTKELCERSYGGVLFIDEAYDLVQGEGDSFGHEAVATLIKQMEDNRDKMIVIFAGYTREMDQFMDSNSGIKSRLSKTIEFPDYSLEELYRIFETIAEEHRILMDETVKEKARETILAIYTMRDARFGNAREMRNLFETVWKRMVDRVETENLAGKARRTFLTRDFDIASAT